MSFWIKDEQLAKLYDLVNNFDENNIYFLENGINKKDLNKESMKSFYNKLKPLKKSKIVRNIHNYINDDILKSFKNSEIFLDELFNVDNLTGNHDKVLFSEIDEKKWKVETTTGTTGVPFPVLKSFRDQAIEAKYLNKCRRSRFKDASLDNGFLLIHETDNVLRDLDYRDSKDIYRNLDIVLEYMISKKPSWIFSTTFILNKFVDYIILNKLEDKVKKLPIKFIEITSQKLLEEDKKRVQSVFNCEIADNYGCREMWNIAYSCKCGNLHLNTSNLIVDLIDENGNSIQEEGVLGEVILTSLSNKSMPLLKYYLGDLAYITNIDCECSSSSPIIVLEEGRPHEKLKNTVFYGSTIFRKVLRMLHFHEDQREYEKIKVVQDSDYHLTVYIKKKENYNPEFENKFIDNTSVLIKDFGKFNVTFDYNYIFNDENKFKDQVFLSKV